MVSTAALVRLYAVISFSCSVLDVMSNVMMALNFQGISREFNRHAHNAKIGVSVFTVISCAMFLFTLVDDIGTIASGSETVWLSRLSKATSLTTQELPIAICLLVMILCEPNMSDIAAPALSVLLIKLVSIISGTVKLIKLKFFFHFVPCRQRRQRSSFSSSTTTSYSPAGVSRFMSNACLNTVVLFVSLCQVAAICLVITNICICFYLQ